MNTLYKTDGKLYLNEYMKLDLTANRVLNMLISIMVEDTNLVSLSKTKLLKIIEYTGYTESTIRKALVRLNKSGLAERTNKRGQYIINPAFAVKGEESHIWFIYSKVEIKLKTLRETR